MPSGPQIVLGNTVRRLPICVALQVVVACTQADAPAPDEGRTWSVAAEPSLVIGEDADPAGPLYQVRGAARLSTGYLVANSGEHELRLYAPDGRLLSKLGRQGSGPGEFRSPRLVGRLSSDSVAVFDGNRRLSIVCEGVRVCDEWSVPPPGNVIGMADDFVLLEDIRPAALEGESFDQHTYLGTYRKAAVLTTVLTLDGVARSTRRMEVGLVSLPVPLSARPFVALSDAAIVVFGTEDNVVRALDVNGVVTSQWQLPVPTPPLTSETFRSAVDERIRQLPPARERVMRPVYEAMTPPHRRSPIANVVVDRRGLVWAAIAADDGSQRTWFVMDQEGQVRAQVRMPLDIEVVEIGDDYVIAVWRNALDVEFVRVHTLTRTPT